MCSSNIAGSELISIYELSIVSQVSTAIPARSGSFASQPIVILTSESVVYIPSPRVPPARTSCVGRLIRACADLLNFDRRVILPI